MAFTSAVALVLSLGLRFWGFEHPDSFVIRPLVVLTLLFAPSVFLAFWLVLERVWGVDFSLSSDE